MKQVNWLKLLQCCRKLSLQAGVSCLTGNALTLSPHKAEKLDSPTVTNSCKAEMPACRSLIYSRKAEISAWKFRKKTVKNNVVSGSSGSVDPMLCELG